MDNNRPMTKRERQEARRLEKLANPSSKNDSSLVKWIILVGGSVLFLAAFAFIVFLIKQNQSKPVVISTSTGHIRGAKDAKVTLIEFGDFECPSCKGQEPNIRQAMKDYNGKLRLIFKHFPLTSIHPNAMLAAQAAEAAGLQGKFFELHDVLYDKQDEWATLTGADAREKIMSYAKSVGLDMDKFKKDIDSSEVADKIGQMQSEAIDLGVNATPTFYINNKKVEANPDPNNYSTFKALIDSELKK